MIVISISPTIFQPVSATSRVKFQSTSRTVAKTESKNIVPKAQVSAPAFDPLKPETWPKCASNEIVRADTGKCAKKPTQSPRIAQKSTSNMSHAAIMAAAGIRSSDYGAVNYIVSHESGWRYWVRNNEGSGAYGLCQALPAWKMATAGSDYLTNPVTQLKWCNSYAKSRYGGWWGAYNFWVSHRYW